MKRQKLELSLTQFWSEEFRNELAASVRRPIPTRRHASRRPADPPTRSSLPPRRPADTPTRRHVSFWLLDFLTPAVSGSSKP